MKKIITLISITLIILSCTKSGKNNYTEIVIRKSYEKVETIFQTQYNNSSTIEENTIKDKYFIVVRKTYKNDTINETFLVSKNEYQKVKIGDNVKTINNK